MHKMTLNNNNIKLKSNNSKTFSFLSLLYRWKREPLITKEATLNPEIKDDIPKNKNPTNPKPIEISDCTQNTLLVVHVSISLIVRTNSVPVEFADSNKYANTYTKNDNIFNFCCPPSKKKILNQMNADKNRDDNLKWNRSEMGQIDRFFN